jgi:ribonuclease HI
MSNEEGMKEITIYTDGGCLSNPGPGGYGVVLLYGKHRKELSGGYRLTTNNRMELMAAIEALKALKEPCAVKLYSDSRYVVDGISLGWAEKWRSNNWWRTKSEQALNPDLWEQLLLQSEKHQVEFIWVKGHVGNKENERCDALSYQAAEQDNLPQDAGYDPDAKSGKVKITREGEPCRKCATPVVKVKPKRRKSRRKQKYYFEYYFHCPNCDTIYNVEAAKREVEEVPSEQLSFLENAS